MPNMDLYCLSECNIIFAECAAVRASGGGCPVEAERLMKPACPKCGLTGQQWDAQARVVKWACCQEEVVS